MCHVTPSSIITIYCWPKENVFRYYVSFIHMPSPFEHIPWHVFLFLYHIHILLYYRFLLMHHACLSMQHACLLILHGSWAGTVIATALQANGVLCIMYISLCFMVICSYSMALYSSITPAFSCTLSVYSKIIAFNLMPLVCLSVHHSQMLNLLVWLFMHLIV